MSDCYIDVELHTEHGGKDEKSVGYTPGTWHDRNEFSRLEPKENDRRDSGADGTPHGREDRNHQKESW